MVGVFFGPFITDLLGRSSDARNLKDLQGWWSCTARCNYNLAL